ncbi:hypothetical protein CTAYLR_009264 [Chrysophaeum taylorii]|uniref:Methyltransferase domain-containing protein n=1 Tax=Chrysophaeum taylorii TaxID=2483200 RepID=A0AAD7U8A8_9STRA|nr:hypothetical protein CTAYLR_009264 [Chrysophaeum taylorii]
MVGAVTSFAGAGTSIYSALFEQNRPAWELFLRVTREAIGDAGDVLDVASGPGEPAVTIARSIKGARVTASDKEESMTVKAAARAAKAGASLEVIVASAEDIPRSPASFDVVTMSYGLSFVSDKPRVVAEVARVLRPGGTFAVSYWRESQAIRICEAISEKIGSRELAARDPLGCARPGFMETLLGDGWTDVTHESGSYDYTFESADDAFSAMTLPMRSTLAHLAEGTPDVWAKARVVFDAFVAEHHGHNTGEGGLILGPNTFGLTVARKRKE